jgi:hypothetical protein
MKIRATIIGDKIVCDRSLWLSYLSGLQGDVSIEIKKWQNDRTISQNNYYWKYLSIIESDTGNLATDIHELAKRKFLPPRFIKAFGQEIKIPATTTTLSIKDFSEFIKKIEIWTGINAPNIEQL